MNALVRTLTIGQRLSSHPSTLVWNASIRGTSAEGFKARHFADALRTAPGSHSNPSLIAAWISGPLNRFFPFSRCVGFYGEFMPGRVAIRHRIAVGFDADALQRVEKAFLPAPRGCAAHAFQTRRPLLIDCAQPPPFATASDIALFQQNKPAASPPTVSSIHRPERARSSALPACSSL